MTNEIAMTTPVGSQGRDKLFVGSYDSGYEHSLEHLLEVRRLVEDTEFLETPDRRFQFTAKAS